MKRIQANNKKITSKFITAADAFIIISILCVVLIIGVVVKYVLQKDTYVTVELLASGGEWWWGVPPPYYWNTEGIVVGAKEYDAFNKPTSEVVDVVKYGEDDRKFVWMKVRLKTQKNSLTKEYVFRQESLQIGKTIHIAPNNVSIIGQVVGIEGVGSLWKTEYLLVTGKALQIKPWESDAIVVGDKLFDNNGRLVAEVVDKSVDFSDMTATTWTGDVLAKKNPLLRDVVVTLRLRTIKNGDRYFFNYYQPISIGGRIRIQFRNSSFEINIMSKEVTSAPTSPASQ